MGDNTPANPSESIVTEKVSRALQVRTDTPAMKAALDALSHLPSSESKEQDFSFDSRSVRVAIERDALQQALKLQEELRSLVTTVQQLRQGITATADIAHRVRRGTQMPVITAQTPTSMIVTGTATASNSINNNNKNQPEDASRVTTTATTTAKDASLSQEVALASQLSDAFLHRDMARKRLQAVHAFLERFDLSQQDSRLLDHYNFEDVQADTSDGSNTNTVNGQAFLKALERVRHIRVSLQGAFGGEALLPLSPQEDRNSLGASSALRMMENLAQKQERAYERLYQWLQQYLHLFSSPNNNNNNSTVDQDALDEALQHAFVKRSLYTLRHVPAFYSHTLELIASSRRAEETRRFLLALTSGYAGMQPIEMKAHDPVACTYPSF